MSSLICRIYSGCLILFVLAIFKRVICSPVENSNYEKDLRNKLLKLFIPVNRRYVQASDQEYKSSNILRPQSYVSSYENKEKLWFPEGDETRYDETSAWWHHTKNENLYPDSKPLVKEGPAQKSIEHEKVFGNNENGDRIIFFDDDFPKTNQKYRRFTSTSGNKNNGYHHGHHLDFEHHSSFHHDHDFHHPDGFQHDHTHECHYPRGGGPGRFPYAPRSLPRPGPPPRNLPPPIHPSTRAPSTTNPPRFSSSTTDSAAGIDPRQRTIVTSTRFPNIDLRWNGRSAANKGSRERDNDEIVFPE